MTWIAPASEAELRESLADPGTAPGPGGEKGRLSAHFPTGGGDLPGDGDARGGEARERDAGRLAAAQDGEAGRLAAARDEDLRVISLERPAFAGIVEYEPKDLTITVGAGMRLGALRDALQSEGQWLPPGAWGRPRSVGGMVGAGAPGPFDHAFGSVRRHVLAVRTLSWGGRPLTWGRAVVKNVAGYDLKGLWCGSRGRLGVVTQASLRVWPLSERREWLEVRGSADGWTLLDSLARMAPAEDFRPDATLWRGSTSGRRAHALICLLGSEASVRLRGARAREWAARLGHEVVEAVASGSSEGGTPAAHLLAPLAAERRSFAGVTLRVHCPRESLANVARRLARALADTPATLDALPELGSLRVSYRRPDDGARAAATRAALFQAAGSVRITVDAGGPEELAAGEARWEACTRALGDAVLRALGGEPRHWLADYV